MLGPRNVRRAALVASLAIVMAVLTSARDERGPAPARSSGNEPLAAAQAARVVAAVALPAAPARAVARALDSDARRKLDPVSPSTSPRAAEGQSAERPPSTASPEASAVAATLLADAASARRQGDLRTTLALLRTAVERAPSVETHAALGGLYFELGAARAATKSLRAAAEGDPENADRWIALANALALAPDPMAAARALAQARAAEPALRVTRDAGGSIVRVSSH